MDSVETVKSLEQVQRDLKRKDLASRNSQQNLKINVTDGNSLPARGYFMKNLRDKGIPIQTGFNAFRDQETLSMNDQDFQQSACFPS